MVLLTAAEIKKSYITRTLFSNVSFQVSEGDRVGLVGVNGCGKTTLFHLITRAEPFDGGELHLSKNAVLGYVRQHADSFIARSAYEEVLSVFAPLMETERELAEITAKISQEEDGERLDSLVRKQHALSESFERDGGYTFRGRVRSTLIGLGVDEEMQRDVRSLSGGEKAKVLLASMLLCGANLLLWTSRRTTWIFWLWNGWRNTCFPTGAYIVISHDRYFLDRVTNRTFEIENGRLLGYAGS